MTPELRRDGEAVFFDETCFRGAASAAAAPGSLLLTHLLGFVHAVLHRFNHR